MFETMDKDTKFKLKIFISFTCTLIALTLILAGITLLGRSNWNNKLKIQVETVLTEAYPESFPSELNVGNAVKLNSTISTSSNMYEIVSSKGKNAGYALILRVTTYYGPQAGVFYYSENGSVSFAGFACLNSRVKNQFSYEESDILIKYWKFTAEKIFKQVIEGGADNE